MARFSGRICFVLILVGPLVTVPAIKQKQFSSLAVQARSRMASRTQAGQFNASTDPLTVAASVSADAAGYAIVSAFKSNEATSAFIERVIDANGGFVDSWLQRQNIQGMAPWYKDGTEARFQELVKELKSKSWALSPAGLKRGYVHRVAFQQCNSTSQSHEVQADLAPLTEEGYECIAVLSDESAMAHFISRVVYAYGGTLQRGDEAYVMGMSRWYSGQNGVQSFNDIVEELRRKDWALCTSSQCEDTRTFVMPSPRGLSPNASVRGRGEQFGPSIVDMGSVAADSIGSCKQHGADGEIWKWWNQNVKPIGYEGASQVLEEWKNNRPAGNVFYDSGTAACFLEGSNGDLKVPYVNTFTLVSVSDNDHCQLSGEKRIDVEPHIFTASADEFEGEQSFFYATVAPKKRVCTKATPCPLVVSLHGAGEHGSPAEGVDTFARLMQLGFLKMVVQDPGCMADLKSVLLFPQLPTSLRWEWSGRFIFTLYVLPLMRHIMGFHSVDQERIALVGYSEGATGAVHGALRHPDIFSLVFAVALTWGEWWELPWLNQPLLLGIHNFTKADTKKYRLKMISLSMGELQKTSLYGANTRTLGALLRLLDKFQLSDFVSLHTRFYAGLDHFSILDRTLNKWSSAISVLWNGDWI